MRRKDRSVQTLSNPHCGCIRTFSMHSQQGFVHGFMPLPFQPVPKIHNRAHKKLSRFGNGRLSAFTNLQTPCCQTARGEPRSGGTMLQKSDAAQGRVRPEARQRSTPKAQIAVERRRGQRLLNAWHSARGEHLFPSFAALEAAANSELMHHSVLLRWGHEANSRSSASVRRFRRGRSIRARKTAT